MGISKLSMDSRFCMEMLSARFKASSIERLISSAKSTSAGEVGLTAEVYPGVWTSIFAASGFLKKEAASDFGSKART